MKSIQTLDKNEWLDNSDFISEYARIIVGNSHENFSDNINYDSKFIKEFWSGFNELFKLIFKKYVYDENLNFLYPICIFLVLMETFVNSSEFLKLSSSKNRIGEFLIDEYLLNENFFTNSFLQNEQLVISFGEFTFEKIDIFDSLFRILEHFFRFSNYGNKFLIKKINENINNLKKNLEWNSLKHRVFLHLSILVININEDEKRKEEPLEKSSLDFILSFLKYFSSLPQNERLALNHDLYLSLFVFRDISCDSIYLNYLLQVKNDIIQFLSLFNSDFHETIVDCIFYFIDNVEYEKENYEFFSNIQKLDPSKFSDKLQIKIKQIIHVSNEKTITKLKYFVSLMDCKNCNENESKG